jgi:hypothetical protein
MGDDCTVSRAFVKQVRTYEYRYRRLNTIEFGRTTVVRQFDNRSLDELQ